MKKKARTLVCFFGKKRKKSDSLRQWGVDQPQETAPKATVANRLTIAPDPEASANC